AGSPPGAARRGLRAPASESAADRKGLPAAGAAHRDSAPCSAAALALATEDGDDILDGHDEQPVVTLEIHRDAVLGVEQHAVVLPDRIVIVGIDLGADGDDAPRERGDLDLVGQVDARL